MKNHKKTLFLLVFRSLSCNFASMKQAMIFAAGLGTRLKPLTDTMPKALVPVGGRPLLDINIERLHQQGYNRFVVNVHHFAQQIIDYVSTHYSPLTTHQILISDESDRLLDTGGGLKKAAPLFHDDEPILIHNVDILDNVDYEWFRRQHEPDEDAVLLVSRRKTKRYLLFDSSMRLMGWINIETGEVKSPYPWLRTLSEELRVKSEEFAAAAEGCAANNYQFSILNYQLNAFAFSGIHSFSPRLFPLMERFPDKFSIIDFYLSTCHRARIYGCVKDDLQVLDVGKLDALDKAETFLTTNFTN